MKGPDCPKKTRLKSKGRVYAAIKPCCWTKGRIFQQMVSTMVLIRVRKNRFKATIDDVLGLESTYFERRPRIAPLVKRRATTFRRSDETQLDCSKCWPLPVCKESTKNNRRRGSTTRAKIGKRRERSFRLLSADLVCCQRASTGGLCRRRSS